METVILLTNDEIIEAKQLFNTAETLREEAQKNGRDGWPQVRYAYENVITYLEKVCLQHNGLARQLDQDSKSDLIVSAVWSCYSLMHTTDDAHIEMGVMGFYDDNRKIARNVRDLEIRIKSYRYDKKELYNLLQGHYDQWCEEWRGLGKKYEADELQYYMLNARMKWALFQLMPWLIGPATRLAHVEAAWAGINARRWKWIKTLEDGWFRFSDALRAMVEWLLYKVGKSLVTPFIIFVLLPIMVCGLVYAENGCVSFSTEAGGLTTAGGIWNAMVYSVFVFTGAEAGAMTMCNRVPGIHTLMAFEALFAYIFMMVVIGYLVNRLSSR
jgi:hypothetical protein